MEQKRESFKPVKTSLTATKMPAFVPSTESTEVMTSILDAQKVKIISQVPSFIQDFISSDLIPRLVRK